MAGWTLLSEGCLVGGGGTSRLGMRAEPAAQGGQGKKAGRTGQDGEWSGSLALLGGISCLYLLTTAQSWVFHECCPWGDPMDLKEGPGF